MSNLKATLVAAEPKIEEDLKPDEIVQSELQSILDSNQKSQTSELLDQQQQHQHHEQQLLQEHLLQQQQQQHASQDQQHLQQALLEQQQHEHELQQHLQQQQQVSQGGVVPPHSQGLPGMAGHGVPGLTHPAVSNGFSGADMPLGMAQSLVQSLAGMGPMGLQGLAGLEGLSTSMAQGMLPGLTEGAVTSTSNSLPVTSSNMIQSLNPMLLGGHDAMSSHLPAPSLADLKMAGLDTSLGYSYPGVNQGSTAEVLMQEAALNKMDLQQQAMQQQANLVNYLSEQEKKNSLSSQETPKTAAVAATAPFNKPKAAPKNLHSWSSLAQSIPSPGASSTLKNSASDSFAQFKKVAKEKEARQRQIMEQQEIRRQQKEAVEKEKARAEAEREQSRMEEEALARTMELAKERQTQELPRRSDPVPIQSSQTRREGPLNPSVRPGGATSSTPGSRGGVVRDPSQLQQPPPPPPPPPPQVIQQRNSDPVAAIRTPAVGPKVATPMTASTSPHPQLATPAGPPSSHPPATPTSSLDAATKQSDRDRQKLREQERRRREAMAGQIDMNRQSDLMAAFEEQCGK